MRKSSFRASPDQLEDDKVLALQLEALIPYMDELIQIAQEGTSGHLAANILDGTTENSLAQWDITNQRWEEFLNLTLSYAASQVDLTIADGEALRIKDSSTAMKFEPSNGRVRVAAGLSVKLGDITNDYIVITSGDISSGLGSGVMSLGNVNPMLHGTFNGLLRTRDFQIIESAYFQSEVHTLATIATGYSLDFRNGNKQKLTVANNITVTLIPAGVGNYQVQLVNGGNYSLSFVTDIKWAQGITPTWTTDGIDMICLYYDGSQFYGSAGLGFA